MFLTNCEPNYVTNWFSCELFWVRRSGGTDGRSCSVGQRMRLYRTERSKLQKENVCSHMFRPTIWIKTLLAIEIFECLGRFACLTIKKRPISTKLAQMGPQMVYSFFFLQEPVKFCWGSVELCAFVIKLISIFDDVTIAMCSTRRGGTSTATILIQFSWNWKSEEIELWLCLLFNFNVLRHQLPVKMAVKNPLKPGLTWIRKQNVDSDWSWPAEARIFA